MSPASRMSAEERRELVVEASMGAFAAGGYEATSTEDIAKRAGISQPYIFRLFGSKKELFLAAIERCFDGLVETFVQASEGLTGEAALKAMGLAYADLIKDRDQLRLQLHAYTASTDDPDIRAAARRGLRSVWKVAEGRSGADAEALRQFFAAGMLCNLIAAVGLDSVREEWAAALCPSEEPAEPR